MSVAPIRLQKEECNYYVVLNIVTFEVGTKRWKWALIQRQL